MSPFVYVFLGGGAGSLARYLLSEKLNTIDFPLGTLTANLLGTLLIGALAVVIGVKGFEKTYLRELVLVGFLGGLTTFSSFTNEAFTLWQENRLSAVGLYLAGNLVLGFLLLLLGRKLAGGEI